MKTLALIFIYSWPLFLCFCFLDTLSVIKCCWWLDLNPCPLVLEATTLPPRLPCAIGNKMLMELLVRKWPLYQRISTLYVRGDITVHFANLLFDWFGFSSFTCIKVDNKFTESKCVFSDFINFATASIFL